MKTQPVVITAAVVVIVVLGGVAVRQNSKLTDAAQSLSSETARNAELQGKVSSLEQEVAKLKETADYYYQQGVDLQSSGNLADAKGAFEAVVAKFPTSNLVGSAQQRLVAVNEAITKVDADRAAEAQRQQEEQRKDDLAKGILSTMSPEETKDMMNSMVGCPYGYTTDSGGGVHCKAKPIDVQVVR